MNRLKKILLSFVLPFFCLLISVSNAEIQTGVQYHPFTPNLTAINNVSSPFNDYTFSEIINISMDYVLNNNNKEQFDNMCSYIDNSGYYIIVYTYSRTSSSKHCDVAIFRKDNGDFGIGINQNTSISSYFVPDDYASFEYYWLLSYYPDYILYKNSLSSSEAQANYILKSRDYDIYNIDTLSFPYSNCSVKNLSTDRSSVSWDGSSYYYEISSTPGEPEIPSLPSNADITKAVQAFYNTIYNQPNISFDDFFVLYDKSTGLYSYIGHTRGNAIGQVIVEPNGYYNGYIFDKQWWQFFLDEQNDSWEWQNITKYNNYYLYSSQGDIDTLKLVGQDKIDNLFTAGPWAISNTVIVYSTNDYPVKYITFSDESPDPVVEEGTIKGDQYTYDENLDITDNQYNPLENFVSVDYPSSLVSRAEFDKFMETFDENKDFLILPTDSNWIVIACNSLFNHFSSFIIMCAVFIIVERIMRG